MDQHDSFLRIYLRKKSEEDQHPNNVKVIVITETLVFFFFLSLRTKLFLFFARQQFHTLVILNKVLLKIEMSCQLDWKKDPEVTKRKSL